MSSSSLSGRRIGGYDVGPLVGAGGMGEVYRARDSKLNRDVAIKILLASVASDADRLARFRREAQVLALLNHQNIAHIHGIEEAEAGPFLVMEFVEGPTLADRIAQGPIPVGEALAIARQIAGALEAAHERGVVHRDLKPANIKVADDGTVKVLDFGLAKALDPVADGSLPNANSPTITTPAMTQAGVVLGTAAYMSPEQAKGRAVDKRTDVWAFGCVLYEMLTAGRAFPGEDVADTIAAVIRAEPDWRALHADTPRQIRLLLTRCLDKDRRTRLSDISIARFLMDEPVVAAGASNGQLPATLRRRTITATVLAFIAGAVIASGVGFLARRATPATAPQVQRFSITTPADQILFSQSTDHDIALSPDGSSLVYRARAGAASQGQLMLRVFSDIEPRPIAGTVGARNPFFSPDGRWIGFFSAGELRKVPLAGGPPVAVCQVDGAPRGASWGEADTIVYATSRGGLYRVSGAGGEPRRLLADADPQETHVFPWLTPGATQLLFTTMSGTLDTARIDVLELANNQRKTLLIGGFDPVLMPTGHLIYATSIGNASMRSEASLRAVAYDIERQELRGQPIVVVERLGVASTGAANYSVSQQGHLVYVTPEAAANAQSRLRTPVWVNRKGQETPLKVPPRGYAAARLSPDQTRVAFDVRDQTNDIWIWDLQRQTLSVLDRHPATDISPLWTPDGRRVVWSSTRAGGNPNIYARSADGTGEIERLTTHPLNQFPASMSPDGSLVVMFGGKLQQTGFELSTLNLGDRQRGISSLLATAPATFGGELSPDGQWLAYHSNESGDHQVYVRPFPNVDSGRWQISTAGGTRAAWARNGRELFYLDHEGLLTAVSVEVNGEAFKAGAPSRVLNTVYYAGFTVIGLDMRAYDVSADGQRFLMLKEDLPESPAQGLPAMVLVLNWVSELRSRVPIPPR